MRIKTIIFIVDGVFGIYAAALRAAYSVRAHMPDARICWFTSMPHYECALADEQHSLPPISPFKNKLIAALSMKSDKNLFLDADTFVVGRIDALFDMLEESDFAIGEDQQSDEFNSGVFSFNRRGSRLLSAALARLDLVAPQDLIRGNREQRVLSELICNDPAKNAVASVGTFDSLVFNLRPVMFENIDETGRRRASILHSYGLRQEIPAYFPWAQEEFEKADAFARLRLNATKATEGVVASTVNDIEKIIAHNPQCVESYLALASYLTAAGRRRDAIDVLDRSAAAHKTEPGKALFMKAKLHSELEDVEAAVIAAIEAFAETSGYEHPNIAGQHAAALSLAQDQYRCLDKTRVERPGWRDLGALLWEEAAQIPSISKAAVIAKAAVAQK